MRVDKGQEGGKKTREENKMMLGQEKDCQG